jgi:hypothetical protein
MDSDLGLGFVPLFFPMFVLSFFLQSVFGFRETLGEGATLPDPGRFSSHSPTLLRP